MAILDERTCWASEVVPAQVLLEYVFKISSYDTVGAILIWTNKLTDGAEGGKPHRSERKLRNFTPVGNAAG